MEILKKHKCFGGEIQFRQHDSKETKTKMAYSVYLPASPVKGCLFWLSGLTCTDENFMAKAGAQKALADAGLMVVCPDTSPRGLNLPGEKDSWDFGAGAGFYVDAKTEGYRDHYRMYSYVAFELYDQIVNEFSVQNRVGISGHSMGGHGALVLGLREQGRFRTVSAFSPIVNPLNCPWGVKAFTGYLGEDRKLWTSYDACELLRSGQSRPEEILIDQGLSDPFLKEQLLTSNLEEAANSSGQATRVRYQDGYDHSYYFISTFIGEHIAFHAKGK